MTVTKPRILHAVPDDTTPAVIATIAPRGRHAALTGERQEALRAMQAPEVIEERTAAVTSAMHKLAVPGADRRKILNALAEAMFVLGRMNGAADERNAPYLKLTEDTLAEVLQFETAERDKARQAERAITGKAAAK
jgi:hypothetical protein